MQRWEADGTYRFDRTRTRDQVFAIDTPPPTVSGSLHIGHVFSYTHTDTVARFQRMRGKAVFYPIGLGRQRPGHRAPGAERHRRALRPVAAVRPRVHRAVPRRRARRTTAPSRSAGPTSSSSATSVIHDDEEVFEELVRRLGLSVDWSLLYTTIGERAQRASQRAFLRNLAPRRGLPAGRADAVGHRRPNRGRPGRDGRPRRARRLPQDRVPSQPTAPGDLLIDTTRPELLASCVAMVAHPDDARYKPLFGTTVRTPLFGVEVPVLAHHLADPDKGTGIAMICTFGDTTDVTWWRELDLPSRALIGFDGRLAIGHSGVDHHTRRAGRLRSRSPAWRRSRPSARSSSMLIESGEMLGEPRPISHPVKFYERGSRPLEIVATRQWYIRNGGRDDGAAQRTCSSAASELTWHPAYMHHRYENWVGGLNGDWLISRQRFFGVPIPLWYRLDAEGNPLYDEVLVPADDQLPIDPSTDCPDGFHRRPARQARRVHRRPRRDGHLGDVVAHPADRRRLGRRPRSVRPRVPDGHAPAGPRHHPHLAVRHRGAQPPRARLPAVDATRRSPAGSSTPTARRCRRPRATSSRRSTCSRSTAPTPCATGRRPADPASTPRSTRGR